MAGELLPSLSPRAWESLLAERLASVGSSSLRFRLIRCEGRRAVVEVDHLDATRARSAWSASIDAGGSVLRPYRTWGTLVGAKAWLREQRRPATGA